MCHNVAHPDRPPLGEIQLVDPHEVGRVFEPRSHGGLKHRYPDAWRPASQYRLDFKQVGTSLTPALRRTPRDWGDYGTHRAMVAPREVRCWVTTVVPRWPAWASQRPWSMTSLVNDILGRRPPMEHVVGPDASRGARHLVFLRQVVMRPGHMTRRLRFRAGPLSLPDFFHGDPSVGHVGDDLSHQ